MWEKISQEYIPWTTPNTRKHFFSDYNHRSHKMEGGRLRKRTWCRYQYNWLCHFWSQSLQQGPASERVECSLLAPLPLNPLIRHSVVPVGHVGSRWECCRAPAIAVLSPGNINQGEVHTARTADYLTWNDLHTAARPTSAPLTVTTCHCCFYLQTTPASWYFPLNPSYLAFPDRFL